ncbi:MAG TPA: TauD/TfdA family dioxygenase [Alphaproteobacteria bacterium]
MNAASPFAPPRPIIGPMAWSGRDITGRSDWILRLDDGHIAELEGAGRAVMARRLEFRDIASADFPLPRLGPTLAALRPELRTGRGFVLVKGLSVARYDAAMLRTIYVGMGTHLGVPVSQSYRGDYLGEVKDYREPGNERPYRRGGAINMHRDPCDIVGLLCYRKAKTGGLSRISSAATVWNIFLAERPDLVPALLRGFRLYITQDDRNSTLPVTPTSIPVLTQDPDGPLHCTFIAELAEWAVEKAGEAWPPGGPEAIAFFREVANREGVYLDMAIEPGDIQFLNNRTTIHGRTDYEEWPEPERQRIMFRLWLMCPDWPQPKTAVNRVLFGKTDRADGGVFHRLETAR